MKPKFKKGDKIYFDGPYRRAVWKILDVRQGAMWQAPGKYYLAKEMDQTAKGWKAVRKPFSEEVRVVDPDFKLLSEAPAEWVPCKDPMPGLMRMMKPLDPLNKFKLIK